jgi:hypothetical protein
MSCSCCRKSRWVLHPYQSASAASGRTRGEARQQSQWRRQSERSDRDGSVHSTPVSPPNPSSGVASPRSGWALAALNTPAQIRLSALARFGSSVKKSLYARKGKKFHCLSRRWNFRLEQGQSKLPSELEWFSIRTIKHLPGCRVWPATALSLYRVTLSPTDRAAADIYRPARMCGQAIDRFGLWASGWMALLHLAMPSVGTSGLDFVRRTCPNVRWYLPWRPGRWRRAHGPRTLVAQRDWLLYRVPAYLHRRHE